MQKLSARDPEKYGPAAQQLKAKADKTLQRQREKRQHEKNLVNGIFYHHMGSHLVS